MTQNRDLTRDITEPSWVVQFSGRDEVVTPLAAWRLEGAKLISNVPPAPQHWTLDLTDRRYTVWRVTEQGDAWRAELVWHNGNASDAHLAHDEETP